MLISISLRSEIMKITKIYKHENEFVVTLRDDDQHFSFVTK